jgi:hypothetical protein
MQKFIGKKRDTLEGAGEKGAPLEVALGVTVSADPAHPEVHRALRVGSLEPVPTKTQEGGK